MAKPQSTQFDFDMTAAGIAAVYVNDIKAAQGDRNDNGDMQVQDRPDTTGQTRSKPKRPSMYKVLLHDDDTTPAEYVVAMLRKHFDVPRGQAIRLMTDIHETRQPGVVAVYSKEVAEAKVEAANREAAGTPHPFSGTRARGGIPAPPYMALTFSCEKE